MSHCGTGTKRAPLLFLRYDYYRKPNLAFTAMYNKAKPIYVVLLLIFTTFSSGFPGEASSGLGPIEIDDGLFI